MESTKRTFNIQQDSSSQHEPTVHNEEVKLQSPNDFIQTPFPLFQIRKPNIVSTIPPPPSKLVIVEKNESGCIDSVANSKIGQHGSYN